MIHSLHGDTCLRDSCLYYKTGSEAQHYTERCVGGPQDLALFSPLEWAEGPPLDLGPCSNQILYYMIIFAPHDTFLRL